MKYISKISLDLQTEKKNVAVFGSTGSIGKSSLIILKKSPHLFNVHALIAGKNINLLAEQACEFKPKILAISDEKDIDGLKKLLPANYEPEILVGKKAYQTICELSEIDTIVSAQVGAAGLRATVYAVKAGKTVCLANKESLVLAGDFIRELAYQSNSLILPVDSEHYALFQCLLSQIDFDKTNDLLNLDHKIKRLILTASGGPFRGKDHSFLEKVNKNQALKHPNWNMGAKISIDSATLMNKGLEIIEACHLFGLPIEQIDAIIHPQSIIHSLVEWQDGSMLAQLSKPDMKLPIGACLAFPKMLEQRNNEMQSLDLLKQNLSFEEINHKNFPCLNLAKKAFMQNLSIELNAANEVAVQLFLEEKIKFTQIPNLIENLLEKSTQFEKINSTCHESALEQIEERDFKARKTVLNCI